MPDVSKSVLIVDDNATIRAALRAFLEGRNGLHVCGEAFNGIEALVKADELNPGLIIMDLSMPNMNGVQAAWAIRQTKPDAKIVLFTLYPHIIRKLLARTSGVDIVVPKADGPDALMQALQPLLEPASVPQANAAHDPAKVNLS